MHAVSARGDHRGSTAVVSAKRCYPTTLLYRSLRTVRFDSWLQIRFSRFRGYDLHAPRQDVTTGFRPGAWLDRRGLCFAHSLALFGVVVSSTSDTFV